MGHAIPSQHPAVVLRSHFNLIRALLGVAMVAVVGLTIAVVILATDEDRDASTGTATQVNAADPAGSARYDGGPEEGTADISTAQARVSQGQAFPGLAREALEATQAPAEGTRYDGGPEEGSRGIVWTQPLASQDQAFPGLAQQASAAQPDAPRYDGGPEEGTRGSGK